MSVQMLGARHRSAYDRKPTPSSALAHIPGDDGWPLVGHTLVLLSDPKGFVERRAQRYGPIYRSRAFGQTITFRCLAPRPTSSFCWTAKNRSRPRSAGTCFSDAYFLAG